MVHANSETDNPQNGQLGSEKFQMSNAERLQAMHEGAEIAKQIFVQIVRRFPTRAEVGAAPTSPEYEHFQFCASTLNAMEFEDEDFLRKVEA